MIITKLVNQDDDLTHLVQEINSASWDHGNEMCEYDVDALSEYLGQQGTLFVTCHEVIEGVRTLQGIASSRLELKPYGRERWLYVDEIDVYADQRRKGAGRHIMKKLFEIARASNCEEVWLGAEATNQGANGLYRSLNPDDVAQVIGYTYEIDD